MFENIINFFKRNAKKDKNTSNNSKDTAKERLHLVLMQDRANVSVDFLELMKQEIIDVIKKYIDVDESAIDVRLTNKENEDGTNGAPALYANIPIINIKNDARKLETKQQKQEKTDVIEKKETEKKSKEVGVKKEEEKAKSEKNKENKEEIELDDTKKEQKKEEKKPEEAINIDNKKEEGIAVENKQEENKV